MHKKTAVERYADQLADLGRQCGDTERMRCFAFLMLQDAVTWTDRLTREQLYVIKQAEKQLKEAAVVGGGELHAIRTMLLEHGIRITP